MHIIYVSIYLSTADRAKQIKTQAVVNEDPTDKLIRELQEENEKLKEMLESGGVVVQRGEGEDGIEEMEGMSESGKYTYREERGGGTVSTLIERRGGGR